VPTLDPDVPTAAQAVDVAAPPDAVYRLVSDIGTMPDWAAEVTSCRWVGRRIGPLVGRRFVGFNRNGRFRWFTLATVTDADPGREFAFHVHGIARWSYLIEPGPTGCRVTERMWDARSWVMRRVVGPLVTGVTDRASHNSANMVSSLDRLREAAERSA